jgi:hypothetical protein
MANIYVHAETHAETPVPPGRILAALTDFTDRRFDYWPNLDRRLFQAHATGDTWAEVTEGAAFAGGTWERGRCDWSTPGVVRLEVTDSNAFQRGSYWEYRVSPDGRGGSHVELTVLRLPCTAKGRLLTLLLGLFGRRIFTADLAKSLQILGAAHDPARA